MVKELSFEKFDATVELSFRLNLDPRKAEQNLRGAFVLPNGTGKTKKVLVFAKGDKVKEAEQWFRYQQILVKVMDQISDLTYALNLGAISRKNSCALMGPYAKQANDTLVKLNEWHNRVCKKLEINTDEQRRKRQGIEGFFMSALGAFNDDLNYKKVSDEMIHRIENQTDKEVLNNDSRTDLFQEDVNLIVKDGKVFYLPQTG